MARIIFKALGILVGLVLFLTCMDGAVQSYSSPVPKEDLFSITGRLTNVTQCTGWKKGVFFYTVSGAHEQITFKDWCPQDRYQSLRHSVGEPIYISFYKKRGFLFSAERDVYEVTVSGHPLSTYSSRASHLASVSFLTTLLSLTAACCGLAILALAFGVRVPLLNPHPSGRGVEQPEITLERWYLEVLQEFKKLNASGTPAALSFNGATAEIVKLERTGGYSHGILNRGTFTVVIFSKNQNGEYFMFRKTSTDKPLFKHIEKGIAINVLHLDQQTSQES